MQINGVWASFPVADLLSTVITLVWVLVEIKRLDAKSWGQTKE